MKNRKRLTALLLSLALILSLCACGGEQADSSESPSGASQDFSAAPSIEVDLTQDAVAFAAGLSADEVLLTVNGEDIPADLFLLLLSLDCSFYYYNYGYPIDLIADMLLEDAVYIASYYTVCRQKAVEMGCFLTDEQLAEVEAGKTGENRESYEQQKASYGLSDESMDFFTTRDYYYFNLLDTIPRPTDEELTEYLDRVGAFYVKHILLMTVDDARQPLPEDAAAEKKFQAEDILAQLQAVEGEEQLALFDKLMNTCSEDSGLTYNPAGYVFTNDDSLVGGFREAALELDEGQISGIVETDYGYHIMLRLAFTDEIKESYRMRLWQEELEDQMAQWIEAAEVVRAPALDELDVAAFYERSVAYQNALYEQYKAANNSDENAVG